MTADVRPPPKEKKKGGVSVENTIGERRSFVSPVQ